MISGIIETNSGSWSPGLSPGEQCVLFEIAGDTLSWCASGSVGEFEFDGYEIGTTLEREFATFVTLRVHGDLRGCIGCLDAREALYRSVHRNTHRAACEDTRFAPVTADEVADIHLGISMLSAQQRIETPEEFEVGRQGVVLHKAGRSAVFLPQVAVEQGWTREETLDALCHKAGLQSGAWREDATFTVFESACLERAGSS